MASVNKYSGEAIVSLLRHNQREIVGNSNADIVPEKTEQNYSFPMPNHNGLTDYKYYKKLLDSNYIYGRGTQREKDAITACSWVVTAPKEIVGFKNKEDAFFKGVFDFISNRYGSENIINNSVHYDEAGAPHIHIIFVPSIMIDHDKIRYKTVRDKKATQLESGRWVFDSHLKLDNGEKISVKNYAKMSDYYEKKLSANDVLNKAELRHFHSDLQKYLDNNGIEGRVVNGATSGINFSIKKLKEFTNKTGLKLEDIKEHIEEPALIESFINHALKRNDIEISNYTKEELIETIKIEIDSTYKTTTLEHEIKEKDAAITKLNTEIIALKAELVKAHEKINELAKEKQNEVTKNRAHSWEHHQGWSNDKSHGWSTNKEKEITLNE